MHEREHKELNTFLRRIQAFFALNIGKCQCSGANEKRLLRNRLEALIAAEGYFFEQIVSPHPKNDIQIKKINTIGNIISRIFLYFKNRPI